MSETRYRSVAVSLVALAIIAPVASADLSANRPPTVSIMGAFGPSTIFYADSPAGGIVTLNAIASDPDGDALTYSWTGPFTNHPATTNLSLEARLPLGAHQTIRVTVNDGHGGTASASIVVDVVGTPFVGTTATPIDSEQNGLIFNYAPVTITATAIGAGPNNAYLRTHLDQVPPVPSTLQAGSPPIYFDVSTDAALMQPPIQVCVDTTGMSFADPAHIRLYQYQQLGQPAAWTNITSSGYPQGHQICGQSDTLGTFAIFYPQVPPTAVQTIAGNGVLVDSVDGPDGDPIDDYADGPATSTPLNYLVGGAYDRANNRLFVSDGGGFILRLNLNNNTITRVAGNGVFLPGIIDGPNGDPRDDLVEAGNAFNTYVGFPGELTISPSGDVLFFDRDTCLLRRLDLAQSRLFAVAGNGACGFSGDGFTAGLASISFGQLAFDAAGNLFIGDGQNARVRRIDAVTNIISTVVGDGTRATPVNGASALSPIGNVTGIAFDSQGQLLVAIGMDLLRVSTGADGLINGDAGESISIVGGCHTNCQLPFNGDGFPVSNPHVYLPGIGHLMVARDGAVLFPDSFRIRRIAPGADGIVTGASDDIITSVGGYFDWATSGQLSNFNGDTFSTQSLFGYGMDVFEDTQGRVIVVDENNFRVRRFGLAPAPANPNGADLAISASGPPDPVDTGADLRYLITVSNNGPASATGVTMTYVIPEGAVFQSAPSGSAVTCTTPAVGANGTVTCEFGTLASGASNAVPITIRVQGAGPLQSTFSVTGIEIDSNNANNTASVTTAVHLGPATISVEEFITVTDAVGLLPSAMIGITENILVSDEPALLPSTMIGVSESILVSDTPTSLLSAMIGVNETIVVTDTPVVLPPVVLTVTENVIVTDQANMTVPNASPVVNAGLDRNVEATSAAGASVALFGVATDADNDPLTLTWSGPCGSASGASVSLNCTFGSHTLTFTADDGHGGVVSDTVVITVRDTTAPALTLPANVTAFAASPSGSTVTFAATAMDIVSGFVTVSCSPASGSTFPIGTTTVTCSASDSAGNPATGSFTVTVNLGTPSLVMRIANKSRDASGSAWIDLQLTNTGTGHARNVSITSITLQRLTGTGAVTYDAARSGPLPMAIGSLDVGATRTVRLYLNVPLTVARFSITEGVTLQNVIGTTLTFSAGQAVIP